ncbi:TIR domain-containing protein [Hydrogenovibrio marinus]|uniref:CD-NTase-associated protein 12/Pycsar effector protein TIR domain-containing protein n=1 Tax=Hydrogenovibrio marinus TaxID=28885 RepID=A0A066ZV17_HYDMR|nr:nucleotide-binding protein [Hydrogenovibrio marinus]KDN96114.1 hypothetical protein EI16_07445 [Hydrogenovibrio marinus]BBN60710.1 hypothetical protein HVMH_2304 [Hydrogenovibrio marinus]
MYYHVIVETNGKDKKGNNKHYYEFDNPDLEEIKELIVIPYKENNEIYIDGAYIKRKDIISLKIKSSERPTVELKAIAQSNVPHNVLAVYTTTNVVHNGRYVTDITKETLKSSGGILNPSSPAQTSSVDKNEVFIVHGRDEHAKIDAARFIESLGLKAIILHEQTNSGKTIIEKIESYTNVGFAIVLYTPCDIGGLENGEQRPRARQNVVFEHGFLIGKLGRSNVCALVKGQVEKPNDISGIAYIPLDDHGAWKMKVAQEMRSAGYNIDLNNITF